MSTPADLQERGVLWRMIRHSIAFFCEYWRGVRRLDQPLFGLIGLATGVAGLMIAQALFLGHERSVRDDVLGKAGGGALRISLLADEPVKQPLTSMGATPVLEEAPGRALLYPVWMEENEMEFLGEADRAVYGRVLPNDHPISEVLVPVDPDHVGVTQHGFFRGDTGPAGEVVVEMGEAKLTSYPSLALYLSLSAVASIDWARQQAAAPAHLQDYFERLRDLREDPCYRRLATMSSGLKAALDGDDGPWSKLCSDKELGVTRGLMHAFRDELATTRRLGEGVFLASVREGVLPQWVDVVWVYEIPMPRTHFLASRQLFHAAAERGLSYSGRCAASIGNPQARFNLTLPEETDLRAMTDTDRDAVIDGMRARMAACYGGAPPKGWRVQEVPGGRGVGVLTDQDGPPLYLSWLNACMLGEGTHYGGAGAPPLVRDAKPPASALDSSCRTRTLQRADLYLRARDQSQLEPVLARVYSKWALYVDPATTEALTTLQSLDAEAQRLADRIKSGMVGAMLVVLFYIQFNIAKHRAPVLGQLRAHGVRRWQIMLGGAVSDLLVAVSSGLLGAFLGGIVAAVCVVLGWIDLQFADVWGLWAPTAWGETLVMIIGGYVIAGSAATWLAVLKDDPASNLVH